MSFRDRRKETLTITCFLPVVSVLLAAASAAWSADWYVRPAEGHYGLETGKSYEQAWSGLLRVKWGSGGVEPGDNLYVCGLHVYDMKNRAYVATQADIDLISGRSEDERITIRGDCPNDPGIIWGAYRMSHDKWRDEGHGVWSIKLPGKSFPDWFFQDVGTPRNDSFVVLDKEDSVAGVARHPGSQYSESYQTGTRLYVKCTDGGSPQGRIYGNRWGYDLRFENVRYVTLRDLALLNPNRLQPDARPSWVRWQNCRLAYGEHSLIGIWGHTVGVEVVGCELSWAANGIYTIRSATDGDRTSDRYLFRGNYIHDIGVRPSTWNRDAHAIGIQGGIEGIIEDNVIRNCGTGPLLYAFKDQVLKDTVVRGNIVEDLHTLGGAKGYGVSTVCDNNSVSDKSGNRFYDNIVVNSPVAYRAQFEQDQIFFHNTADNCDIGLESTRNDFGRGARVRLNDNLFIGSRRYHIRWASGATNFLIESDNNWFYPADGKRFNLRGRDMTLAQWRRSKRQYPLSTFDPHSLTAEPPSGIYPLD